MKVIGLGRAGCSIAKAFSKYPQYKTCGIDVTKTADITIKKRNGHEEYEKHFPNLKKKLELTNESVTVVIGGSGEISGASLRLLEQVKGRPTSVIYIQPDQTLLSEVQKTQEKIVRNVLQEYARSGMIESIYLINNSCVEKGIGDVPILGYYDVLNQALVNTMHMINVFKNTEPIIGNFIKPSELSRIMTFGVLDIEKGEEKWFYDLTAPRDVVYYYGIGGEDLREDNTLFRKITDFVKARITNGVNVSYGIYETGYEQKYCYCIKYSSVIQSQLDDQDIS